jgi:hypothetical protein
MRRIIVAMGACVCLAAIISLTMAQTPSPSPTPPAGVQTPLPGTIIVDTNPVNTRTYTYSFNPDSTTDSSDHQTNELLGKWKTAKDDSDRDHVQKQLREHLKTQFQARAAGHEKEIEQLEAKVKELREQLALRRQKEDEIVDFRLQQLLREAQGLGWGTEPGTRHAEKIDGPILSGFGIATGGGGMGTFQQSSMNGSARGGGGSFSWSASQSGGRRSGTTSTDDSTTASPGGSAKSPAFEGFFKRFDANGNGMLEEDEVKDTPAKSVIESVYKQLGKEVKYPIAISEVLKAIDKFPGRLRVRESSGGKDGSRNLDIDMDMGMEPEPASREAKAFSLSNGNVYTLMLTRNKESDRSTQDSRAFPVEVKNDDGKITISRFGGSKLIIGELRGNDFSGTMNESGGPVKLEGKLTANNAVSGEVTGEDKDGWKTVVGTFTLAPTVLAPTPTPVPVGRAKVFSLESGKYKLTFNDVKIVVGKDLASPPIYVTLDKVDGQLTMSSPGVGKYYPLFTADRQNNDFFGTMTIGKSAESEPGDDDFFYIMSSFRGPIRLIGKLTADNEVSGTFRCRHEVDGSRAEGKFRLVKTEDVEIKPIPLPTFPP